MKFLLGKTAILGGCILVGSMTVAGCSPMLRNGGNRPTPDGMAQIVPGVSKKEEVAKLIGSPSTISAFDDKTWYYVSRDVETIAFFKPEAVDQEVIAIAFDASGYVQEIAHYGLADGKVVTPVERVTATSGRTLTFWQQALGNLGRLGGGSQTRGGGPSSGR